MARSMTTSHYCTKWLSIFNQSEYKKMITILKSLVFCSNQQKSADFKNTLMIINSILSIFPLFCPKFQSKVTIFLQVIIMSLLTLIYIRIKKIWPISNLTNCLNKLKGMMIQIYHCNFKFLSPKPIFKQLIKNMILLRIRSKKLGWSFLQAIFLHSMMLNFSRLNFRT